MGFVAPISKSSIIFVIIFIPPIVSATNDDEIGSRVVGGTETDIKYFPYLVNIAYRDKHHCGGSYLKTIWVLTAAHCLVPSNSIKSTTCRMALTSLSSTQGVQSRSPVRFIVHPEYDYDRDKNDIGIIKISSPFDESKVVRPVTLASTRFTDYSIKCVVPGWGLLGRYRESPDRLRAVRVPLVPYDECMNMYAQSFKIDRFKGLKIICAGYAEGRRDACIGDSGGPLVCDGKQVGIVSFGIGCAEPLMPGIYTDVVAYNSWINKITYEHVKRKVTTKPEVKKKKETVKLEVKTELEVTTKPEVKKRKDNIKLDLKAAPASSSIKFPCSRSYYIIGFTLLGIFSINYVASLNL